MSATVLPIYHGPAGRFPLTKMYRVDTHVLWSMQPAFDEVFALCRSRHLRCMRFTGRVILGFIIV